MLGGGERTSAQGRPDAGIGDHNLCSPILELRGGELEQEGWLGIVVCPRGFLRKDEVVAVPVIGQRQFDALQKAVMTLETSSDFRQITALLRPA